MSMFWCHLGSIMFLEHDLWNFSAKDQWVTFFCHPTSGTSFYYLTAWKDRAVLSPHTAYA